MKQITKVLVVICFAVLAAAGTTAVAQAETVTDYNADLAIKYAAEHWNDAKEADGSAVDCIEFARTCAQKGGVPQDAARVRANGTGYTVPAYITYMTESGYAELNKLQTEQFLDNTDLHYIAEDSNAGKVAPGDILIFKCTNPDCSRTYFHASLCGYVQEEGDYAGYYKHYAHNVAINDAIACKIQCGKCKADRIKYTEIYALHITSTANGFEAYDAATTAKAACTAYNKLKISWTPVSGATSYNVFYKKSKNGFFELLTTVTSSSAVYTVPAGEYAGNVYFAVRPCTVIDGKEYIGAISNTAIGYTIADKPAAIKLKLTDYRSAKVTWSKAKGATGYKVEYRPAGSSKWSFLKWTTGTSATRPKLAAGTKYYFRVTPYTTSKLYTGKRVSTNYAQTSIYTLKQVAKPAVKKAGKKKITVSWKDINGESGYQLSKHKKSSGTKIVSKSIKGNKITIKKAGKYYYKVRAYKVVDGKVIYGPWSAAKRY